MAENLLYYGDNLDILRRYVKDETVDLVYLDPPFNSNANYNVLFAERDGSRSASQFRAFEDTWEWNEAAANQFVETVAKGGRVSIALQSFHLLLGESDMLAYLVMMAPRLVELRRVLKPTGSLYLHCDTTAGHYLKVLLDSVFTPQLFVNEIAWKRSAAHSDRAQGATHFGRVHDLLLVYANSPVHTWNQQYTSHDPKYTDSHYTHIEPGTGRVYRLDNITGPGGAAKGNPSYEVMGVTRYWRYSRQRMQELIESGRIVQTRPGGVPQLKRYLDESKGVPLQDVWDDIPPVNSQAKERLGYPTQKPEALLERIIRTSSDEGATVLDPFCGCGTAISAAQRLDRRWIGIDVTFLAISLIKARLRDAFGDVAQFKVLGEPVTMEDARELAAADPYQFQLWSLGLVGARPEELKKGADKGIDGRLYFVDEERSAKQIVLSVKAGGTGVAHLRDLRGVLDREKAAIGVLITMQEPTQPMKVEALSAGFYESPWGRYPRLQLLTVQDLLSGKGIQYPAPKLLNMTFKKAPKAKGETGTKIGLPFAADGG